MTREQLKIKQRMAELLGAAPVGWPPMPDDLAEALIPYVTELIEAARADEREVCVKVAARMAHNAMTVRRFQRAAAMTQVAETLQRGVSQ